jgi:hypothetical protein
MTRDVVQDIDVDRGPERAAVATLVVISQQLGYLTWLMEKLIENDVTRRG